MLATSLLAVAALQVSYRPGISADTLPIATTMTRSLMNPLSISHERFIVATDEDDARLGFGQIRPLGSDGLWELASVYVVESARGNRIGSEVVRRLMVQHEEAGRPLAALYLLTLATTTDFYLPLGFETREGSQVPTAMAFEVAAGTALSAIVKNKLVCMQYTGVKS